MLVAPIAARTWSMPMPWWLSACGLRVTRIAGSELPVTLACPTPSICDTRCATMLDAMS